MQESQPQEPQEPQEPQQTQQPAQQAKPQLTGAAKVCKGAVIALVGTIVIWLAMSLILTVADWFTEPSGMYGMPSRSPVSAAKVARFFLSGLLFWALAIEVVVSVISGIVAMVQGKGDGTTKAVKIILVVLLIPLAAWFIMSVIALS